MHRQGLSVSAIARQLECDRKTVRKYIGRGLDCSLDPPVYSPRQPIDRGHAIRAVSARADRRLIEFQRPCPASSRCPITSLTTDTLPSPGQRRGLEVRRFPRFAVVFLCAFCATPLYQRKIVVSTSLPSPSLTRLVVAARPRPHQAGPLRLGPVRLLSSRRERPQQISLVAGLS